MKDFLIEAAKLMFEESVGNDFDGEIDEKEIDELMRSNLPLIKQLMLLQAYVDYERVTKYWKK